MNKLQAVLITLIALVVCTHAARDVWAQAEHLHEQEPVLLLEEPAPTASPYGEQGEPAPQTDAVHAATATIHAEAGGHGGEQKEKKGLPQLDPKWFASQIFWLVLTFSALYFIFSRRIIPDLSSVIETRRDTIQNDLDQAEKLRDQAETVHKAYEAILNSAHVKTSDLVKGVESEIKDKANASSSSFRERSTKEIQAMESRIEKAKRDAMDEMTTIAAEIASQAAKKIVGISTDVNQAKTVVQNISKKAA